MSALQGIRIIELAEGVAGEYCGKLLSDLGAVIVKVERPGSGSPTRAMALTIEQSNAGLSGGLFAYLNTNKQSVVLDIASKSDTASLHKLISTADVVIDDHDRDWLTSVGLAREHAQRDYPSAVFCSITPYGLDAPRDRWNAKSLNVFHSSGWGYHTPGTFDPAKPPLKGPGRFLVDYEAALDAALCIVSSVYWRGKSGKGQCIDVSAFEVMVSRADIIAGRLLAGEDEASSKRSVFSQSGPYGLFRCGDGSVYLYMTTRKHWVGLRTLMGDPPWAHDLREDWLEFGSTEAAINQCRTGFAEFVRPLNKDDVSVRAQRLGVPLVSVNDASDLHRSPQYAFRQFFQRLHHPVVGEVPYPTVPYRLSASPATLTAPAPSLGEHTATALNAAPVPWTGRNSDAKDTTVVYASRGGPLAGVRVLELTKVWAGPYAGKLLAFLGAEVIKVESNNNLDEMRAYGGVDPNHAPYFLSLNPEVLSVQVNLKSEQGLKQLREMVRKSDIVLNNLRPGAMERLGLDYYSMRSIKRDIISVSIKMFGNDGPLGYQTGYAPSFAALGGLNYLVGYQDEQPAGINMRYGDSTVGANAAFAAIVALLHRERTGEGQFVDLSAVECMSCMVGDSLFAYGLTGKVPGPDGNAHADMAPHGCYPCAAQEWIAIAIASDDQWCTLCEVFGRTDLCLDPRYRTLLDRQSHRKDVDDLVCSMTCAQDAKRLAERLRSAGVPACKSQSSLDLIHDEWLWSREFFRFVSDAQQGKRPIVGAPWRMSHTFATISRGAPLLGEHNAYVYGEVLGLPDEQIQRFIRDNVIS
jgi:crotonobetainyl-CoA:carnitine CoA-transferase CaiB-like acyl-CoA transferase